MKSKTTIFIIFLLLLYYLSFLLPASSNNSEVILAHFNDLGGRIRSDGNGCGGLVRLAGEWRRFHSQHPNALLLVSGDLITGSALSTLTRGEGVFQLADKMGIDAFTPGNHEFDYGVEQYMKFMSLANFPFIVANIHPSGNLGKIKIADAPYTILSAAGIKVGVIGVISEATPLMTTEQNTSGIIFSNPVSELTRLVPEVDRESQLVVVISHTGLEEDLALAQKVKDIDIIISGHSPDCTPKPIRVGNTWIVHAGENGKYLGIVRVQLNPASERLIRVSGELIPITRDILPDPEISAAARVEEAKLPVKLDEVIGRAARYMDKNKDISPWLAGLMKEYTGAELGVINIGAVRSNIERGPITLSDVYQIMPFDDRVVVIHVKGKELAQWIQTDKLITDKKYDLDYNRIYDVATIDFVAASHHIPAQNINTMSFNLRDLMIKELKRRGMLH